MSDTLDLLRLCQHFTLDSPKDYSWSRATETQSTSGFGLSRVTKYNLKVYYGRTSNELLGLISDVQSVGLLPTPKSIWELIPFSFCVDWFVPMSDILNSADARITWETHKVHGACLTTKSVTEVADPSLLGLAGYVGSLSCVSYSRRTPSTIPQPQFFSDTPTTFHNFAELSALIIATRRPR